MPGRVRENPKKISPEDLARLHAETVSELERLKWCDLPDLETRTFANYDAMVEWIFDFVDKTDQYRDRGYDTLIRDVARERNDGVIAYFLHSNNKDHSDVYIAYVCNSGCSYVGGRPHITPDNARMRANPNSFNYSCARCDNPLIKPRAPETPTQ
jgi:hypothetical protein